MSDSVNIVDTQQLLKQLARAGPQDAGEVSVVTSPGARSSAWVVKVEGLSSYNVYNVRTIEIGDAGSLPVEIGGQMKAVNLAESFLETGQLSAGTFAVMFRVGGKNVFYVPV
jgi:hypothetical protein